MLGSSQRRNELNLLADKALQVGIKGAVCGNVVLSADLLRRIAVDQPPPFVFEPLDVPCDPRKLPGGLPVVCPRPRIDAAPQLRGIEHRILDELEDLSLKDMRTNLSIAAALDL